MAVAGLGMMKSLWGKKVKDEKTGESKTKRDWWGAATNGAMAAYKGAQTGLGYRSLFNNTKEYAKKYGRLLAYSLMLGFPFARHTVSLLSFSLGCQVSKSCLRCLD